MSTTRLFILAVIVMGLIVFFGRSPMDEVRQKRAEKAGRKLVEKIEDANKKNTNGMNVLNPNFNNNAQSPANRYNNGPNPFVNGQKGPNGAVAPPKDDYYPPAPKNPKVDLPISFNGAAARALANPNLITDDGRNIAFWGTRVFMYDDQGILKPIPDGKYPMYKGKWSMVIRGGEQTIANGDTVGWR